MAEVGEQWIWLVYRCSHIEGGVWGGSSTFNANNVALQKVVFSTGGTGLN